ncbi:MAG: ParB N-terminal domain-containing protein [Phycisphaerales bacterium]|nr:ParB N-terminal domain-containing protein [Phycisphaerales bacterium]
MLITFRSIDDITPYDKNPRKNDPAVDAVARSITEFGFRQPVVVDEHGVIIVGHTRWKAARKLGLELVPVHVAEGLTPEQARAYRIADNATANIAQWDLELLPVELAELKDLGLDLDILGFDDDELQRLLGAAANPGLTDPDDIPEPPDEPVTKPGDLWVLGEHRLLCGDSASAADVDRLMDGHTVQLATCDPPYNVNVHSRSNNAMAAGTSGGLPSPEQGARFGQWKPKVAPEGGSPKSGRKLRPKDRPLVNDFVSDEAFAAMLLAWFGNAARVLDPGRGFYIWGGYANVANYPPALKASGLYFSQTIIWDKQHPVLTRKDFMGAHEWCFYGWKEGAAHKFFGPNNIPDLWHVKKVNPQSMIHLTEKPVELAARAMAYSTKPGERVIDLFGGSGSTLIAAEQQGRRAYLMEIDPAYADIIVSRWETFAGKKAEREVA